MKVGRLRRYEEDKSWTRLDPFDVIDSSGGYGIRIDIRVTNSPGHPSKLLLTRNPASGGAVDQILMSTIFFDWEALPRAVPFVVNGGPAQELLRSR